jgi:hypothetical protein
MLHELRKHRLANVHPSLSAIAFQVSPTDVGGRFRPEKVEIEKSQKSG